MQLLGITSYICFAVTALVIVVPLDIALLIFVSVMPLTTVAAFNLGDNSILIYHLVWLIVVLRIACLRMRSHKPMNCPFLTFLLFALATTPLALFNSDVTVIGVDGHFVNVVFSFQQFTQLAYLAMAISSAWIFQYALDLSIVSYRNILHAINVGLVLVLAGAFLQLVLPANLVTSLYRNSVNVGYIWDGDRISSTFQEPSMLSLYLVPLITFKAVGLAKQLKLSDLVLVVLGLVVCFLNNSSSAFLGLAVATVLVVWIVLIRSKRLVISPVSVIIFCAVALSAIAFLFNGVLDKPLSMLFSKLAGEGASGGIRTFNLENTMRVFLEHPVAGVGWGTVRCESLLASWLAMIGSVGVLLFVVPMGKLLNTLLGGSAACLQLAIYLVVALVVLAISVPEPYYLSIWLMVGVAEHFVQCEGFVNAPLNIERGRHEKPKVDRLVARTYVSCDFESAYRTGGVHAVR